MLICLDAGGQFVIDVSVGGTAAAPLTAAMLAACGKGGACRLVHNHPSEASLSEQDWRLLHGQPGRIEISAVNSNGSVFRGAVLNRAGLAALLGQLDEISGHVETATSPKNGVYGPLMKSWLALPWLWNDAVNERLEATGLVDYERCLAPPDATEIASSAGQHYQKLARCVALKLIP